MRFSIYIFLFIALFFSCSTSKNIAHTSEIIQLSKDKWQWMADKDISKLEPLFHEDSRFVHMSGTWGKPRNLKLLRQEVFGTKKLKSMMFC